jgi:geranylgeranyl diphosphate synthase type II
MAKIHDYDDVFDTRRRAVNMRLESYFTVGDAPALLDAMRYSVLAGGKRIRAVLTLAFCGASGGDESKALDAACGVELLHTYSLIHDDLPCMDDDDTRRGMPSNHAKFGEWQAVLAGDALQAAAFEKVLSCDLPPDRLLKMAKALAVAAGERGICGGQTLDMQHEGQDISEVEMPQLYTTHRMKTASLIEAACLIGVYAADGTAAHERAARVYAHSLGLAFQIRDDVLNAQGSATLGKPSGTDAARGKATFVRLLGLDECNKRVQEQTIHAMDAVRGVFPSDGFFFHLAETLANRVD